MNFLSSYFSAFMVALTEITPPKASLGGTKELSEDEQHKQDIKIGVDTLLTYGLTIAVPIAGIVALLVAMALHAKQRVFWSYYLGEKGMWVRRNAISVDVVRRALGLELPRPDSERVLRPVEVQPVPAVAQPQLSLPVAGVAQPQQGKLGGGALIQSVPMVPVAVVDNAGVSPWVQWVDDIVPVRSLQEAEFDLRDMADDESSSLCDSGDDEGVPIPNTSAIISVRGVVPEFETRAVSGSHQQPRAATAAVHPINADVVKPAAKVSTENSEYHNEKTAGGAKDAESVPGWSCFAGALDTIFLQRNDIMSMIVKRDPFFTRSPRGLLFGMYIFAHLGLTSMLAEINDRTHKTKQSACLVALAKTNNASNTSTHTTTTSTSTFNHTTNHSNNSGNSSADSGILTAAHGGCHFTTSVDIPEVIEGILIVMFAVGALHEVIYALGTLVARCRGWHMSASTLDRLANVFPSRRKEMRHIHHLSVIELQRGRFLCLHGSTTHKKTACCGRYRFVVDQVRSLGRCRTRVGRNSH